MKILFMIFIFLIICGCRTYNDCAHDCSMTFKDCAKATNAECPTTFDQCAQQNNLCMKSCLQYDN